MPTLSPYPQTRDAFPDCIDPSDDLVTRDDRRLGVRQLAIDHMQVCTADAAGEDLHSDLTWPGMRVGQLRPFEGRVRLVEQHRLHQTVLTTRMNARQPGS